ncbi:MAG: metallophosphoesterase family protein [Spirochaetales bacterium]|nr:metallophosphoesterase family protein [Spirochaetales bacterium]
MNYAIFSDIHGDLNGLKRIVHILKAEDKVDGILCLGDSLGTPPTFIPLAEILFSVMKAVSVKGNSDKKIITHYMGEYEMNSPKDKALSLFDGLKESAEIIGSTIAITHGSVYNIYRYIRTINDAKEEFDWMIGNTIHILFHGHTHIPAIFVYDPENNSYAHYNTQLYSKPFQLHKERYYLINPGSVGNPKDNSKAGIVLFDDTTLQLRFVRL